MSTVYVERKAGHPVAGIILGILGIAVALLMTLLFGVVAGAAAGFFGLLAVILGFGARRYSRRGVGAIIAGVLAIVLAFSMTITSIDTIKNMRETAAASGVAPNFAKYMDNPYLGLSSVIANAVNDSKDPDAIKTIQGELEALNKYVAPAEQSAVENAPVVGQTK